MTSQAGISLKFERTLNASPAAVYEVLSKAENIPKWYGPSDEFKIKVHTWDCRVGGKYRVEFNTPTGETHIVVGTFKELVPGAKMAYTWSWEGAPPMDTLVTFQLKAEGKGTHLAFVHEGFPAEEAREHHRQGWTGSLERLSRAVA
jgi:uncharacterized protein YndB with AHSA1/START domain